LTCTIRSALPPKTRIKICAFAPGEHLGITRKYPARHRHIAGESMSQGLSSLSLNLPDEDFCLER
jgi:hypothetical protein